MRLLNNNRWLRCGRDELEAEFGGLFLQVVDAPVDGGWSLFEGLLLVVRDAASDDRVAADVRWASDLEALDGIRARRLISPHSSVAPRRIHGWARDTVG